MDEQPQAERSTSFVRVKPPSKKQSVGDLHDDFVRMVAQITPPADHRGQSTSTYDQKQCLAANGLETATFTVCTRIRPTLSSDPVGGENFVCVVPGKKNDSENVLLMTPSFNVRGLPKLELSEHMLDYVFTGETEDEIYATIGRPLVLRGNAHLISFILSRWTPCLSTQRDRE